MLDKLKLKGQTVTGDIWTIKTKYYTAEVQFVAVCMELDGLAKGQTVRECVEAVVKKVRGVPEPVEACIFIFESAQVSSFGCHCFICMLGNRPGSIWASHHSDSI